MASEVYWTLLGLVIERPSYGMGLYRRYERMYGDVLPVSEASHIYRGLTELLERGYVREMAAPRAAVAGMGRQPKPHYHATALGVRSYTDWLVDQVDVERKRQALWVRQLSTFIDEPSTALQVLGLYQSKCLGYAGKAGEPRDDVAAGSREEMIERLVARRQRLVLGGQLSWLKHAISTFEARAGSLARDDSAGV